MTENPAVSAATSLSEQGAALLDVGRAVDAVEVLRQAVAGGEPGAEDLLVRAYLDSGNWHAAEEWLTPLVEQGEVRWAGRLGVALAEIGDAERAEDAFRLAIDSGELAAANDLAILLRDRDRAAEAFLVLERAAEEGDPQAGANLVEMLLESGNLQAAVEAAEKYTDEARPDTIVALADVRALQGELDEAERLYIRAGVLGGLRAHTAYGQFLLGVRGDPGAAERQFLEAGRHAEPGWANTLARFLIDEGRPDEARGYLQVAIDAGDRDAQLIMAELNGEDPTDD